MNSAHVLILHGSPGSGKTTLLRPISQELGAAGIPCGVIDVDQLNLAFPPPERDFWLSNLAAIWPNYARVPGIHVVIATVVADADRLERLRAAVPAASFAVCELTAPIDVLRARVTSASRPRSCGRPSAPGSTTTPRAPTSRASGTSWCRRTDAPRPTRRATCCGRSAGSPESQRRGRASAGAGDVDDPRDAEAVGEHPEPG